jgi:hypothetical protein
LDSGRQHVLDAVCWDSDLVGEQFQNGKNHHLEPKNRIEPQESGLFSSINFLPVSGKVAIISIFFLDMEYAHFV